MSTQKFAGLAAVLLLATGIAACSSDHAPAAGGPAAATSVGGPIIGAIDHAMDRAAEKLRTGDITFSQDAKGHTIWDSSGSGGNDQVRITPKGDLVINGKPVALTAAQRADVLAYREQLIGVAEHGIQVGRQGAALGIGAAREAFAAVFEGKSEQQVKQKVESRAAGVRSAAAALCKRLPALMASQQKLAAAVPEFRPYATMDQKDIDDCRSNVAKERGGND